MQSHREILDPFRAWQRALPNLGAWVGTGLSERDRHVQAGYDRFRAALGQASPGDILDLSPVSGVLGGDWVRVLGDGRSERFLEAGAARFDGPLPSGRGTVGAGAGRFDGPLPDGRGTDPAPPWAALMCFFHAHWLPSATNWQPMRVVVRPDEYLLLRQNRYRSLLGDVLDAFGLVYETHEEMIDAGIYLEGVLQTAYAQGLSVDWDWATEAESHPLDPARFVPFARMRLFGDGVVPDWFERLSLGRVTQRVASGRPLEKPVLGELWREAMRLVGVPQGVLRVAVYTGDQPEPERMGQAMHAALYGETGFLSRMTLQRLCEVWETSPDDAVRLDRVGAFFWERLSQEGRYQSDPRGVILANGKPLLVKQAAKLLKGLASTFGRHFLQFQNTHPLTGVVTVTGEAGYVWLGRVVAVWLWLARARGLSAIVKSGPIILAGPAIQAITASADRPALIVQLGWPLGLEEQVGGHTGLEERLRDKRPPRADLIDHLVFG